MIQSIQTKAHGRFELMICGSKGQYFNPYAMITLNIFNRYKQFYKNIEITICMNKILTNANDSNILCLNLTIRNTCMYQFNLGTYFGNNFTDIEL